MKHNLNEIIVGWKNFIFPSEEVEKIATNRIITCLDCTDHFQEKEKKCGICKCYMPAKVRNLKSTCPIKKW